MMIKYFLRYDMTSFLCRQIFINDHFSFSQRHSFLTECIYKMSSTLSNGAVEVKRQLESDDVPNKKLCTEDGAVDRVRKRKVAVLLAYCGQGYYGMQRNPGCKTIEEDLLSALFKAGFISDDAFAQIQIIQFQRAARTDKGVSAIRQVVSLKLVDNACVETINCHLPQQIRVFAIKRVTKGFNSKGNCDARTYSYLLPTYSVAPGNELQENYRINSSQIEAINSTLKMYEGTHNFYNFTSKKKAQDPSAIRYMIKFECLEPFVRNGVEFIVLQVKGQSFMLHQIRKMVGLALAVVRGLTPCETITRAYGEERIDIPVAPGLGLMLEEVHYSRYDSKFGKDGLHEKLTWSEVSQELEKFKEDEIYPVVINTELEEKAMYNWILTLPLHSFDVRDDSRQTNVKGNSAEDDDEEEEEEEEDTRASKSEGQSKEQDKDTRASQREGQSKDTAPSGAECSDVIKLKF